jgi:hypothetical protein
MKIKNDTIFYQRLIEITSIFSRAVDLAIKENRKLKLPNVFSKMGVVYYQMPDGSITSKSPFKKSKIKTRIK